MKSSKALYFPKNLHRLVWYDQKQYSFLTLNEVKMYPKVVYLVVLVNYAPKPTPKPFILSMNYISEESQESPIFMQFWQILNHMSHSEARFRGAAKYI